VENLSTTQVKGLHNVKHKPGAISLTHSRLGSCCLQTVRCAAAQLLAVHPPYLGPSHSEAAQPI
jgi:hypothetical protein